MRPPRQHNRPREAGAGGTTDAGLGGWSKKAEVEESLRPLDGHHTTLELESFILTRLTKPSIPVILVGPQVSLPLWWVPASRGVFIFLCVITRHFLACEDIADGSELLPGERFFRKIQRPFRWVPDVSWRNHYFPRNKEAFPCVGPYCQPLPMVVVC